MFKKTNTLVLLSTITLISQSVNAYSADAHYTGEVFTVANKHCPRDTIETNGMFMSIDTHSELYKVISTTYDGDGEATFAIPDLRGRIVVGVGQGMGLSKYELAQTGGAETVTLTRAQLPAHSHTLEPHDHDIPEHTHDATLATHTGSGDTNTPVDSSFATYAAGANVYASGQPDGQPMAASSIAVAQSAGGTVAKDSILVSEAGTNTDFDVRSPYIVLRNCITVRGVEPVRN